MTKILFSISIKFYNLMFLHWGLSLARIYCIFPGMILNCLASLGISHEIFLAVYVVSCCNSGKYYYGYNYVLTRVLMNTNGSGQCRADVSVQDQNLITHVRGITFGLQTTALNGNCRLPKLAIAIGPLFRFWVTALACEQREPMHHELPLWSQILDRSEIVFTSVD